ncbi:MAG TPA: P63C domain-containing protein [Pirellulales bacterium]|nr:P63C domain-containing protein [Pirellulales bacterium]
MAEQTKQAKGGKARAAKLTAERKSEIASEGAKARWKGELPTAICDGVLRIGDIEFECAVLEDETRVVSEAKFMEAMGMYRSGALSTRREEDDRGARTPLHLAYKNLKPFVERHLDDVHMEPLKYKAKSGNVGHGIRAEALPKICEVWLDARKEGVLGPRQELIAEKADILIRSFARVGVVALVDEATGYQYERQKDALEKLLEEYLSEDLRRWVRTFPPEYFKELCRLRGVQFRPDMRLPQYFGHLTNDIVYRRIHPRVLEELKERSTENGVRKSNKLHQWFSEEKGHPKLIQHLGTVIGFMRISENYKQFEKFLDKGAPVPEDLPLFPEEDDAQD